MRRKISKTTNVANVIATETPNVRHTSRPQLGFVGFVIHFSGKSRADRFTKRARAGSNFCSARWVRDTACCSVSKKSVKYLWLYHLACLMMSGLYGAVFGEVGLFLASLQT